MSHNNSDKNSILMKTLKLIIAALLLTCAIAEITTEAISERLDIDNYGHTTTQENW